MSRRATVSPAQVERAYKRVAVLLPNVGELRRDERKTWFIGAAVIGETGREAERFLSGVTAGLQAAAFTIGIGRRPA